MTSIIFAIAFILGGGAVVAMGANFISSHTLALVVTAIIGGVYLIGFIELFQYRRATSTLNRSLYELASHDSQPITVLEQWLIKLHPSLHNAVRQRIEDEPVALPTPVLTPYLIGLLVMLGLLGTFIGLVETLKGVVVVLEGAAKLDAIQKALTAPMGGLGLAFGTSVAGVAASAMLGLMSTLSKRDRLLACRLLDNKITTDFKMFSKKYQQHETLKLLESQSQGLPIIVDKLQILIEKMEPMSDNISNQLLANQTSFHASTKAMFDELTNTVHKSLEESIVKNNQVVSESGHVMIEGIKPILQDAMMVISESIKQNVIDTQSHLSNTVQEQLKSLTKQYKHTTQEVTLAWETGLAAHEQSNLTLTNEMHSTFESFSDGFSRTSSEVLTSLNSVIDHWKEQQQQSDIARLDIWKETLEGSQQNTAAHFKNTANTFIQEFTQTNTHQQAAMSSLLDNVTTFTTGLSEQLQQVGHQVLTQQQHITTSLDESVSSLINNTRENTSQTLNEINKLVATSEILVKSRMESEATWLEDFEHRIAHIATTLSNELSVLRDEEKAHYQFAVERLADLESAVAMHLATLGNTLEEPMSQLIELASDTPRAAAEVIAQLRQEISKNIERDNDLLAERQILIEKLDSATESINQSSTKQVSSIERLVDASAQKLNAIGEQFSSMVITETAKVSQVADSFAVSAVELSSLGEAFTLAVNLFNESNSKLMDSLHNIEKAITDSTTRSDEQLSYYVAQAREVIDYSVLTQKEIFEEIRQLDLSNNNNALDSVEVN